MKLNSTSSSFRCSNKPSLPNSIKWSSLVNYNSNISGTAIIPALIPILSPKDLVIAKPGKSSFYIQTLKGLFGLP